MTSGITLNSGCLNSESIRGKRSRLWAKARLRDRLDVVIAHEYEGDRLGMHELTLKHAHKTDLPISDGARRICRVMAR